MCWSGKNNDKEKADTEAQVTELRDANVDHMNFSCVVRCDVPARGVSQPRVRADNAAMVAVHSDKRRPAAYGRLQWLLNGKYSINIPTRAAVGQPPITQRACQYVAHVSPCRHRTRCNILPSTGCSV